MSAANSAFLYRPWATSGWGWITSRQQGSPPGITISTLWGEMAAQLAESAGDPKLYDYVKRYWFPDRLHTSKGMLDGFQGNFSRIAADFDSEVEYRERMISCYPIHPEVFDRLYEDWATLERFQRTRGVLFWSREVGADPSITVLATRREASFPPYRWFAWSF